MSEPTTPTCPQCHNADRVQYLPPRRDVFSSETPALPMTPDPSWYWCDTCKAWLSARPAIPARPASGQSVLPGCEADTVPKRGRKRKEASQE